MPFAAAYPRAELHGIDVAAPCLRYGSARAEALGAAVHFSQQNAERTNFPDGHFDLVVSGIMLHETSRTAIPRIFAECFRLLAPGGVMAHAEPAFAFGRVADPFERFLNDWNTHYMNEPFWGAFQTLDLTALVVAAGFAPERAFNDLEPSASSYRAERAIVGAVKAAI